MVNNILQKQYHTITDPKPDDLIFAFDGSDIFLIEGKLLPYWHQISEYFSQETEFYCFAKAENRRCLLAENHRIQNKTLSFNRVNVRLSGTLLDEREFSLIRNANHLQYWRKTHRYCGNCGNRNSNKEDEQALICLHCRHVTYPRISPCVIVLITRGRELLLARSPHFPEKIYSTLAGFIEPGESLEQALHREVKEEVGVSITNLAYFGSQPWPFPDSLMIGFHANYLSGEIVIDQKEIEDAQWFDIDHLPELPSKLSIGRELIESYLKRFHPDNT